jgi:hypothetical protein
VTALLAPSFPPLLTQQWGSLASFLDGANLVGNDVRMRFDFTDAVNRDDVGMLQAGRRAGFDEIALAGLLVGL